MTDYTQQDFAASIPDAAIEAAAKELYALQIGQVWGDKPEWVAVYEGYAQAVLEVAAPYIRAQALEDAAGAIERDEDPRDSLTVEWMRNRAAAERGGGLDGVH